MPRNAVNALGLQHTSAIGIPTRFPRTRDPVRFTVVKLEVKPHLPSYLCT